MAILEGVCGSTFITYNNNNNIIIEKSFMYLYNGSKCKNEMNRTMILQHGMRR